MRKPRHPLLYAWALVAAFMLDGCAYESVRIISGTDYYSGTILSDWRLVDAGSKRIILKPGAIFAIRTDGVTQTVAQLDVRVIEGEGMVAYLRTVANAFDTTQGIAFEYRASGNAVRTDDGAYIRLRASADSSEQTLRLYNEAALVRIMQGCRRIYEQVTDLPNTEFLILRALPGSTVEIRTLRFDNTDVE